MLLLNRRATESIVVYSGRKAERPLVIRVTEVDPYGVVTLGFEGDDYKVVRTEIYNKIKDKEYDGTENTNKQRS